MRSYYLFVIFLGILTVCLTVIGFSIAGNPVSQQAVTADRLRLSGLSNISYAIESYYRQNNQLPQNLDDLSNVRDIDPKTKTPYRYKTVNEESYKLCATFETDSAESQESTYYDPSRVHKKGYDCITYKLPAYLLTPTPTIIQTTTVETTVTPTPFVVY